MKAVFRDRKTGEERNVTIRPHALEGMWEVWSIGKRIRVPDRRQPGQTLSLWIPERRLRIVHTPQVVRNVRLDRIEVRL